MDMKRIRLGLVLGAVLAVALLVFALLALTACAPLGGAVEITQAGEAGGYELAFSWWSGEKRLEMLLEAGEELQVEAFWETGEVALAILGQNGAEAYRGKLLATGLFTVKVPERGPYGIHLNGNQATGRVLIRSVGSGR